ncbi:ferrochelatase [Ectothiorhodospiraceae bacterium WFHF3C12]|nr:ferrochelatase [Ectothiorhodospiraceae bacterium WFHF3C12]
MAESTQTERKVGVLLTNLGTPDAPTAPALRKYLAEFLWDPRVVEAPRPIWWLVLNGFILRFRPRKSAEAYAKIWTEEGSPLLSIARRQAQALEPRLGEVLNRDVPVALAMRYGTPSIAQGLEALREAGCRRVLVFPLYPQYAAATGASTVDKVGEVLRRWRDMPELRFIRDYHDQPAYLDALVESIRRHWAEKGRGQLLLFSFHGIPKKYVQKGDPYPAECGQTAQAVARRLGLKREEWKTTFQSRFGPERWLKPYTDETLQALPKNGITSVDLCCPGFSADCLETLEENAMTNRDMFLDAGGEHFSYIPCLNDDPRHIDALARIAAQHLKGWLETAGSRATDEDR